MNINDKKQRKIKHILVVVIVCLFVLGGGGLFYWLSMSQKQIIPAQNDDKKPSEVQEQYSPESNTVDVNNATRPTEPDKEAPTQYDGQTTDSTPANSAEYNNEQFRIPEGEE